LFQDFDDSFYKSLFPALAQADAGAVLEHWRTFGIAGNIPGSRAELLRQVGFTNTRWVDELFDYETYLRLNPDLGATIGNEPRAFCHFVLSGMAQGRQISESIAFDPGFYGEYYRNLSAAPIAATRSSSWQCLRKVASVSSTFWRSRSLAG
jgi:hypothetical protein